MAPKFLRPAQPESRVEAVTRETGTAPESPDDRIDAEATESRDLSRRALFHAAGGLGLAGLVARYAPAQLEAAQGPAGTRVPVRRWDMEADVVVVGYGASGGAAAA